MGLATTVTQDWNSLGSSSEDDQEQPRPEKPKIMADLVAHNLVTSVFDDKDQSFLPRNCIDSLVVEERVMDTLRLDRSDPRASKLVGWICTDAKKLFAIVVQTFVVQYDLMVAAMRRFKKENFADKDLPAKPIRWRTSVEADSGSRDVIFPAKIWQPNYLRRFHDVQWSVLSPVFTEEEYNYTLHPNTIMPIIWKGNKLASGNFGTVFKAELHPSHQEHLVPYSRVAVKKFSTNEENVTSETEDFWEKEARALRDSNKLSHPHMIKCLGAIKVGNSRYFMFPWADGGTLKAYWEDFPEHSRKPGTVRHMVEQLRGLADALCGLHYYKDGESIRHGDLKPENILCFFVGEPGGKEEFGLLKIADMGLAKRHIVATRDRRHATSTNYGTRQYEPPEVETSLRTGNDAMSRRYDVWSMGCIMIQFIIWVLYGNKGLEKFNDSVKGDQNSPRYYEVYGPPGEQRARIHTVVSQWMDHIRASDPECQKKSAIGDLLHLIREQLLVVDISPDLAHSMSNVRIDLADEPETRYRAEAKDLRIGLDDILANIRKDPSGKYLLVERNPDPRRISPPASSALVPSSSQAAHLHPNSMGNKGSIPQGRQGMTTANYGVRDDKWDYPIERKFPREVLQSFRHDGLPILPPDQKAVLCDRCRNLDFWCGGFSLSVKKAELEKKQQESEHCDFCEMMIGVCSKLGIADKALFSRYRSTLKVGGGSGARSAADEPCLSLVTSEEFEISQLQLGLPQLPPFPEYGPTQEVSYGQSILEAAAFRVPQMWLKDCDENHPNCQPEPRIRWRTRLPTRLIHVGKNGDKLFLYETTPRDQQEYAPGKSDKYCYVALSHPWGDTKAYKPFMTTRSVLDDFKKEIPYHKLPATFEHAVRTTRALGKRYLWIDSLCIVQGPDGDFSQEAERMEDVFSSAYCVIAASRVENQLSGFLKVRKQRKFIQFTNSAEQPFFVCEAIDNFKRDVEEGSLNQRAWVLQERALARRTVFFAATQTYFECGEGVRCETLSKLTQTGEEFLGDPNFPRKAIAKNKGEKIRDFQHLFKLYSGLKFTNPEDRPIAIFGLEDRLRKAYGAKGGYGVFDDGPGMAGLFHRSLLWKCAENRGLAGGMKPITFPAHRAAMVPPSWSWMGSLGRIDYVEVPGNRFEWEKVDIQPPMTFAGGSASASAKDRRVGTELRVNVRQFRHESGGPVVEKQIIFDDSQARPNSILQCVVVAKEKAGSSGHEKRHYILVVDEAKGAGRSSGDTSFRRIGVGYLPGKFILWDMPIIRGRKLC